MGKINRNLHIVYTITENENDVIPTMKPLQMNDRRKRKDIDMQMLIEYLNDNEVDNSICTYISCPNAMTGAPKSC